MKSNFISGSALISLRIWKPSAKGDLVGERKGWIVGGKGVRTVRIRKGWGKRVGMGKGVENRLNRERSGERIEDGKGLRKSEGFWMGKGQGKGNEDWVG